MSAERPAKYQILRVVEKVIVQLLATFLLASKAPRKDIWRKKCCHVKAKLLSGEGDEVNQEKKN